MKILVTGTNGQLTRSLQAAERPDHMTIVAIGRPDMDLADAKTIAPAVDRARPDLIVNAAAYTAVDKAEEERAKAQAINADGAGRLADICAARDIPLIHVSTDYVFDGTKAAPYRETDPVAPCGAYGETKLAGEQNVTDACPHSLILRTAWVYSPYGNNFVKTMLRLAETRDTLRVVDDQRGCPTYAPHLADAIIKIAAALDGRDPAHVPWGVYHAAGTGETTWCGLARAVFDRSKVQGGPYAEVQGITTADYPTPARRPANSRLDCTKLAEAFGIRLPDWREGVAACLTELSSNAANPGTDHAN